MDTNVYALEFLARDRLERARALSAHERLVARAARPGGAGMRGVPRMSLLAIGRWVRGAVCWSVDVGDRLGSRVA